MTASVSLLRNLCLGSPFPSATTLTPEHDGSAGEYPLVVVTVQRGGEVSHELLFQGPLAIFELSGDHREPPIKDYLQNKHKE
jgi:hypothetical protein